MVDYTFVRELSQSLSTSGGTSLITMYIPSCYSLSLASEKLTSELSTAPNIKSKAVRKNVISAIKSAQMALKSYKHHNAPLNGLVLCAGESNYYS